MERIPKSFYRARLGDCDFFGHLNNARYIDYFLNAREDHLRDHYGMDLKNLFSQGIMWVVGSHEILYRRPVLYNELVCISSSLLQVTIDSIMVEMQMMDEKEKHLKSICWTNFIPVNAKTGKKESQSPAFMEFALNVLQEGIDVNAGIKAREVSLRATRV